MFYNYFRSYDPKVGRYTQSDPIGIAGGLNTFGYALNNPMSEIDPFGLLVIGRGCNKGQEKLIKDAEAKIRKELEKGCSECNGNSCVPCKYLQQLKQALDTMVVSCMTIYPTYCAEEDPVINIEKKGFNMPGKRQCGCLKSIIYHELFHVAGLEDSDHAIIEGYVMQCFGNCARWHDPIKYPDYKQK